MSGPAERYRARALLTFLKKYVKEKKKERKNEWPASVTNEVSQYALLTVIKYLKPLSFRGLHTLDPTSISDMAVSQIRYLNMLIWPYLMPKTRAASEGFAPWPRLGKDTGPQANLRCTRFALPDR